jgi:hypothetical protein
VLGHTSRYTGPPAQQRAPWLNQAGQNKNGGQMAAVQEPKGSNSLDEVDLSRQIARDFETNFLLANSGLCPDFHGVSSSVFDRLVPVRTVLSEITSKTPISFR